MRRRLRRRRDSVAALVVMASLSLTMRRRLAVVDNDGDGVTGDNNYDDFDNATDFAVVAMADGVVALIAMASLPLPMRRHLAIVSDDGDSATGATSSASSASAKSARPLSSLSTPSHRRRCRPRRTCGAPFWRRRRLLRSSCGCSDRCGGWCNKKLTLVIRNYEHRWLRVVGVWNSLLAKQRWKDLFDSNSTICKYIFTLSNNNYSKRQDNTNTGLSVGRYEFMVFV
jgi:hypothetical protein